MNKSTSNRRNRWRKSIRRKAKEVRSNGGMPYGAIHCRTFRREPRSRATRSRSPQRSTAPAGLRYRQRRRGLAQHAGSRLGARRRGRPTQGRGERRHYDRCNMGVALGGVPRYVGRIVNILRPATIIGRIPIATGSVQYSPHATSATSVGWVGETRLKPVTARRSIRSRCGGPRRPALFTHAGSCGFRTPRRAVIRRSRRQHGALLDRNLSTLHCAVRMLVRVDNERCHAGSLKRYDRRGLAPRRRQHA